MQSVGIGGVQIFEGGMGAPQATPERLVFRTEKWYDAFIAAVTNAKEKGIEVSIASSGGWSVLGAPFVKPENAMKKFVWSETDVASGSGKYSLNSLPNNDGNFQDMAPWGREAKWHFGGDIACLAVPQHQGFKKLIPQEISISRDFEGDTDCFFDDSFASWIKVHRDVEVSDEITVTFNFDEPTTAGSAQLGIAGATGFGAPELPDARLEYSLDGESFEPLTDFAMTTPMGQMGEVNARTAAFSPVTAKHFRLVLTGKAMADALPVMMPGILPLPFKPKDFDKFMLSEFALYEGGRVHAAEMKAAFGTALEYFPLNKSYVATPAINSTEIIDVTEFVNGDELHWEAPAGNWRIIRVGYSLTGHENGPAPVEATGLEVDKLDGRKITAYLEEYFAPLFTELEKRKISRDVIGALLSDSIESRAQNFTETLFDEFEKRRGYSMRPWLPAITGWVVNSAEDTDKFLYDFRLTLADLVSDNMYRLLKEFAHENDARYYSEALESHRPQLGDDMTMRSHADVPMGAMWTWLDGEKPLQTYLADLKGASSVSHVYGKSHTGCESFSTFGKPFVWAPQDLKKVADLEFVLGVTVFNIHSSPHQPDSVAAPGITLAPTLGQWFTRNETWAEMSKPWVDYISSTSYLLNQGSPVADILYFTGCESPVTGIWGDSEFDVPRGYDFDLVSADGLLSQISAANGRLKSAQGDYAILYLGGNSQLLTVEVLKKLKSLAQAGAKIYGAKPTGSPTLGDDEDEFHTLVSGLWSMSNVTEADSISSAINAAALKQDWKFTSNGEELNSALVLEPELRCIHRKTEVGDVYFVSNAKSRTIEFEAEFSVAAKNTFVVDAVTHKTKSNFKLDAYESCYVIITDQEIPFEAEDVLERTTEVTSWTVTVAGETFEAGPTFDLTESQKEAVRYYSGEFTAETSIGKAAAIELPDFGLVASVKVNGQEAGVIWAKGQQLAIGQLATENENRLELTLTSAWRNRLIGDEHGRETSQPGTYLAYPIFEKDALPMSAGLNKPAILWI